MVADDPNAPRPEVGRRNNENKDVTADVRALLAWLDDIRGDLTVRELEGRFRGRGGPSEIKWAEYLSGTTLISPYYLEMLVRDRVREPRHQEVKLTEGRRLLSKAEHSTAGPLPVQDKALSIQVCACGWRRRSRPPSSPTRRC